MAMKTRAGWISGLAVAFAFFGGVSCPAQTQERRVLKHESEREELFRHEGRTLVPVWEGGALLGVEGDDSDEPSIFGIDKSGKMERLVFSIPGGRHVGLSGLAGARDGTIAAVGSAYSGEGHPGTFLARITGDRSRTAVVQLWPYVALALTVASDGRVWTIGYVKTADNLGISEYNVLKRFDSLGNALATASVQAHGTRLRGRDAAQGSLMKSSKDRVGWLTNANEYIEFGLDGRELGRFQPAPGPAPESFETTIALSDRNEVLVGTRDNDGLKVWSLDRDGHSWKPVGLSGANLTRWAVLGFDGDTVVVIDHRNPFGATVARYSLSAAQ